MKIVSLTSYRTGYRGIMEEKDEYVYFICYRDGRLKKVITYQKRDFTNYEHFAGILTRFAPASFFLKEPILVTSLSAAELDKLYSKT